MANIIDLKNREEAEKEIQESPLPIVKPEGSSLPIGDPAAESQSAVYEADTLYHEREAPEFVYHEKSKKWFVPVGLLTVATVGTSIFLN